MTASHEPRPTCLVLAPAWADPRAFERETRLVRAALAAGGGYRVESRDEVEAQELAARLAEVRPTMVHLSGRGGAPFFPGPLGGELSGSELAEVFAELGHGVECVLLNGYFTRDRGEALRKRVKRVIGVPGELPLEKALAFWEAFYATLARGRDYSAAFTAGCERARAPEALAPTLLVREPEATVSSPDRQGR